MDRHDWLAEQFEAYRDHLRAVAYRMLGSLSEADDAAQTSWLNLSRLETSAIENLGGWTTTIVARVCLDMLRSRKSRRENYIHSAQWCWLQSLVVATHHARARFCAYQATFS